MFIFIHLFCGHNILVAFVKFFWRVHQEYVHGVQKYTEVGVIC